MLKKILIVHALGIAGLWFIGGMALELLRKLCWIHSENPQCEDSATPTFGGVPLTLIASLAAYCIVYFSGAVAPQYKLIASGLSFVFWAIPATLLLSLAPTAWPHYVCIAVGGISGFVYLLFSINRHCEA